MCIHHILFIRSAVDGRLDCSCFGATRNDAATDTGVQAFVWTCVSSSLWHVLEGHLERVQAA